MHLTYAESTKNDELMQGDVLTRTNALDALLKEVHPHFFKDKRNLYFLVLTQSCDLVVRGTSGCKSPYITIAPVRSLDHVIDRYVKQLATAKVNANLPVLTMKTNTKTREFLHRLFNNNESNFFYLHAEGTPLQQDCVAFLNLSIAIKTDLHLKTCLDAKILQLTDTFQAKLGWLVGQLYSRVGTQDWDHAAVKKKIDNMLSDIAIWIDDGKLKPLESRFKAASISQQDVVWTSDDIKNALLEIPTRKQAVVKQAGAISDEVLKSANKTVTFKLRRALNDDEELSSLIEQISENDSEKADERSPCAAQGGADVPDAVPVPKKAIAERVESLLSSILQEVHTDTTSRLRRRLEDDQALTQICERG